MRDQNLALQGVLIGGIEEVDHLVPPERALIGAANGAEMMRRAENFGQALEPFGLGDRWSFVNYDDT